MHIQVEVLQKYILENSLGNAIVLSGDFNIDYKLTGKVNNDNIKFNLELDKIIDIDTNIIYNNISDYLTLSNTVNLRSNKHSVFHIDISTLSDDLSLSNSYLNNSLVSKLDILDVDKIKADMLFNKDSHLYLESLYNLSSILGVETISTENKSSLIFKLDLSPEINLQSNIYNTSIFELDILPNINLQSNLYNISIFELDILPEINLQTSFYNVP